MERNERLDRLEGGISSRVNVVLVLPTTRRSLVSTRSERADGWDAPSPHFARTEARPGDPLSSLWHLCIDI
jgi:hypothetical protein